MILSDLKWESKKRGPSQISPTGGEHEGKELIMSGKCLLCAGLRWCSSYIIPLTGHNSPAEEILLFSLFYGRTGTGDALLHLLPLCLPSPASFRQLEPSMTVPSFKITVPRGSASLGICHTLWGFITRLLTEMRRCPSVFTSEPGLLRSKHGMVSHQAGQVRLASHCNCLSDPQR